MSNVVSLELCKELYGPEEWRRVPGLESKLEVSNLGRIRSMFQHGLTAGRVRKVYTNKEGYQTISYKIAGIRSNLSVHVSVAKAFVTGVEGAYIVNHLDNDPSHNCAHNLEWTTVQGNVQHAIKQGRMDLTQNRGEKHGMHRLMTWQVINILHCKGSISGIKLAKLYSVDDQTIYDIWNGRRWNHVRVQ